MRNHIDSLEKIDITKLSFSDIAGHYMTGISISSGSGRGKTYKYRYGVQTDIGDIRLDVWCELAELLIQYACEQKLQENLLEFLSRQPYPKKQSPDQLRQYALGLHIDRVFDHPAWVCYIPFNREFRPEALIKADIIRVTTHCCPKPGEITEQQIRPDYGEDKVFCPFCGKLTTFQRLE